MSYRPVTSWEIRQRAQTEHSCSDCPNCWPYDQTPELPPRHPLGPDRWKTGNEPRQVLEAKLVSYWDLRLHCGHTYRVRFMKHRLKQVICPECAAEKYAHEHPPETDCSD